MSALQSFRLLRPTTQLILYHHVAVRHLSRSDVVQNFWEPDRKGGRYKKKISVPPRQVLTQGLDEIKTEVSKFKDECITKFKCDNVMTIDHGDYEILWKFNNKDTIDSWITTADSDHNEGKSKASFILGSNQKGLFSGQLNTEIPKDGIVKSSGYCNIRSPNNFISFKRERPYIWEDYTHLLMGVRGDGRVYQICIQMDLYFDLQWNDQYNYPLYTRGGPYWQIAKIPFSKFYLSSKGRIQDKQRAIQLDRIKSIGITLGDAVPGPFSLEIDFIGLIYDENHVNVFDYEMYPVSMAVFS